MTVLGIKLSKKLCTAVISAIVIALQDQIGLSQVAADMIQNIAMTYIGGQSAVDSLSPLLKALFDKKKA